ncbi:MAG: sulfatase family protein [Rhodanobacteraceae bacterium]
MADDLKNASRRDLLKAIGVAVGSSMLPPGVLAASATTPAQSPQSIPSGTARRARNGRPNILWIEAEGIPISVLSCYGSQLIETPNIDRIAREGMRFHNAFCTNALCAPSRSTLLTGKYANLTGMITNPGGSTGSQPPTHFDPAQETFARILKRHGYQTTLGGKWHLGSDPGKAGFDTFMFKRGAGGPYYDPKGYLENPHPGSPIVESTTHAGYSTDVFTDYTIKNIERMAQAGKPFLMLFAPFNDHRPFDPPHRFANLYRDTRVREPGTFWDDYAHRASAARMAHMRIEFMPDFHPPADLTGRQRKQWNYQQFMAHFLGALHALDQDVGKILAYLDHSGLADDTAVVFTSDHGFFVGDHGWFDKRFMYEQAIRVPWMIRWPGRVPPSGETEAWTINVDNAPTVLDLAGLTVPGDMQGRSVVPLLDGSTPKDWKRDLYYHYYEFAGPHWGYPNYGVRTDRYKLISYYRQNEWELFDLEKDPDEMDSLMNWGGYKVHPSYETIVADLVKRLKALRQQYHDETGWPVKYFPTSSYD